MDSRPARGFEVVVRPGFAVTMASLVVVYGAFHVLASRRAGTPVSWLESLNWGAAVTVLSLLGTLAGTAGGIIVSGKLVNYRIEQLEKKVEKHNNLITRTFRLEQAVALLDERVRVANHRISDLEKEEVE